MLVAFGAIMYFFIFRPNQKRERERRDMLASLAKGDEVVTAGGMCGTIVGMSDKTVVLRVSEDANIKIEFQFGSNADGDVFGGFYIDVVLVTAP